MAPRFCASRSLMVANVIVIFFVIASLLQPRSSYYYDKLQGLTKAGRAEASPVALAEAAAAGRGASSQPGDAAALSSTKTFLFIGILSAPKNADRRDAIRDTLFTHPAVTSGSVAIKFFLGKAAGLDLSPEMTAHNDLVVLDYQDSYRGIAKKTFAIMLWGARNTTADFTMKADDDSFIVMDRLLKILRDHQTGGRGPTLFWGMISVANSSPHRDKESAWYLSYEEYPQATFPPFAFGVGYVAGAELTKYISRNAGFLRILPLEDVSMGLWVEDAIQHGVKVHFVHHGGVTNMRSHNCGDMVVNHYVPPSEYRCLWKKFIAEGGRGSWCSSGRC